MYSGSSPLNTVFDKINPEITPKAIPKMYKLNVTGVQTCALPICACYTDKVDDEDYTNIPRTRTATIKIDTYTVFEIHGYAENLLIGS